MQQLDEEVKGLLINAPLDDCRAFIKKLKAQDEIDGVKYTYRIKARGSRSSKEVYEYGFNQLEKYFARTGKKTIDLSPDEIQQKMSGIRSQMSRSLPLELGKTFTVYRHTYVREADEKLLSFGEFLKEATPAQFYGNAKTDKATMEVIKEFQAKFKKLGWKYERQQQSATTSYVFTDPASKAHTVDMTVWLNHNRYGCQGACILDVYHTSTVAWYDSIEWDIDDRTEASQLEISRQVLKWIKGFEG